MFFCLNIKVIMFIFISLPNSTSGLSWTFVAIYLVINSHHTLSPMQLQKLYSNLFVSP